MQQHYPIEDDSQWIMVLQVQAKEKNLHKRKSVLHVIPYQQSLWIHYKSRHSALAACNCQTNNMYPHIRAYRDVEWMVALLRGWRRKTGEPDLTICCGSSNYFYVLSPRQKRVLWEGKVDRPKNKEIQTYGELKQAIHEKLEKAEKDEEKYHTKELYGLEIEAAERLDSMAAGCAQAGLPYELHNDGSVETFYCPGCDETEDEKECEDCEEHCSNELSIGPVTLADLEEHLPDIWEEIAVTDECGGHIHVNVWEPRHYQRLILLKLIINKMDAEEFAAVFDRPPNQWCRQTLCQDEKYGCINFSHILWDMDQSAEIRGFAGSSDCEEWLARVRWVREIIYGTTPIRELIERRKEYVLSRDKAASAHQTSGG